ncbi:MAG: C40 family peptidase [Clostridia bacterium]|nr:C40 family peptidase [Clostridia bacterium]
MNDTKKGPALRAALVETVSDEVGKGVYVWGGNGELLTGMPDPHGWIERRETSPGNAKRAQALFDRRRKAGTEEIRAFDCSGLVYWALKKLGVLKTDVSSRGLYAMCRPVKEDELLPGDLVFHHDGKQIVHVGICAGADQIECRGRDAGVVRNRRRSGYWNRFGRLPCTEDEAGERFVYVRGGSVRVREGGGVQTRCIGIVHKGERYPLLGAAPSGWYRIAWRGAEAYITNRPQYTEVRDG